MSLAMIGNTIALSLAAAFCLVGLLHVAAPDFLRKAYRQWQFPRDFHYVAGSAQLLAALFLAAPQLRIWGGILGAAILFVTIVSLLNHRKYAYAISSMLVAVSLAPAMIVPM